MIVQIAFLPKSETAINADKRLILGMNKFVPHEFGLDPELPLTHVAPMILLAGVRGYVGQHLLPSTKLLAAVRTYVREHVSV